MSNVIDLSGHQVVLGGGVHLDADRVLESAKGQLEDAFILGIDKDGDVYFAGTHGRSPEINMLLDRFKHFLLTGDFV